MFVCLQVLNGSPTSPKLTTKSNPHPPPLLKKHNFTQTGG